MALKLITPPATPCLTTAEAKLHLRVDTSADDALIDALVLAATADAEGVMKRAVMPQTWQFTLDSFFDPGVAVDPLPLTVDAVRGPTFYNGSAELQLRMPPVTAVVSVKYLDAATGTLTTMNPADYVLGTANDYVARLVPAYGKAWPATRAMPEAVQVQFTAGYANAAAVPELIKMWIKLRLGALYENRAAWTLRHEIQRNEHLDHMLDRYRTWAC